jgi:hypothetical protein
MFYSIPSVDPQLRHDGAAAVVALDPILNRHTLAFG